MSSVCKWIALIALLATILPCVVFFMGWVSIDIMKWATLAGTVLWFLAAPVWMREKPAIDRSENVQI